MANIYDRAAWKRLAATAGAVASFTAYSTYMDNRLPNSTVAFTAATSTSGKRLTFIAYEPSLHRYHILRVGST
jgi:hypothetical protein